MSVHLEVRPNNGEGPPRIARELESVDMSHGRYVRLAAWVEPRGNGHTARSVRVTYDDIPELIALLAQALADEVAREREEREAQAG